MRNLARAMFVTPMFGVASFLRSLAGRRLAGILGAAALLLIPVPASAAATITRDTITTPFVETGLLDDWTRRRPTRARSRGATVRTASSLRSPALPATFLRRA